MKTIFTNRVRSHMRSPLLLLLACALPLLAASAIAQTTVTNTTFPSGQTTTVTAPNNIDTSGAVNVNSGANVTFQTTRSIRLAPGVTITNGSYFHALLVGITSPGSTAATSGLAFNYQIAAGSGQSTYSTGVLPAGLSLNSSTGLISGTPTIPGNYYVTLTVNNANGTFSTTILISVSENSSTDSDNDGIPNVFEPSGHSGQAGIKDTANTTVLLKTTNPL